MALRLGGRVQPLAAPGTSLNERGEGTSAIDLRPRVHMPATAAKRSFACGRMAWRAGSGDVARGSLAPTHVFLLALPAPAL